MVSQIECFKCKYFHVTWDPKQPRGCKAYGFKTAKLPSIIVKETSGQACTLFTPKKSKDDGKLDLNDRKNW